MKHGGWLLAALLLGLVGCSHAQTRGQAPDDPAADDPDLKAVKAIRDVADFIETPPLQVSAVALVTGLEGTGGSPQSGEFRQMLEAQLQHDPKVHNVKEILASPDNALVLVTSLIPSGIRKGDPIDVEVVLPQGSRATSLRGGYLHDCPLLNYESRNNLVKDYKGPGGNMLGGRGSPLRRG